MIDMRWFNACKFLVLADWSYTKASLDANNGKPSAGHILHLHFQVENFLFKARYLLTYLRIFLIFAQTLQLDQSTTY